MRHAACTPLVGRRAARRAPGPRGSDAGELGHALGVRRSVGPEMGARRRRRRRVEDRRGERGEPELELVDGGRVAVAADGRELGGERVAVDDRAPA